MRRFRSTQGAAKLSTVLTLAIIVFLVYEGAKFGPVLFAQFEFKDAVLEQAKFSHSKKPREIQDALARKAGELGLPVAPGQIEVFRQRTKTRIVVTYKLSVEWLPGQLYTWNVREDEDSVLF